jgi:hypothetical protein
MKAEYKLEPLSGIDASLVDFAAGDYPVVQGMWLGSNEITFLTPLQPTPGETPSGFATRLKNLAATTLQSLADLQNGTPCQILQDFFFTHSDDGTNIRFESQQSAIIQTQSAGERLPTYYGSSIVSGSANNVIGFFYSESAGLDKIYKATAPNYIYGDAPPPRTYQESVNVGSVYEFGNFPNP